MYWIPILVLTLATVERGLQVRAGWASPLRPLLLGTAATRHRLALFMASTHCWLPASLQSPCAHSGQPTVCSPFPVSRHRPGTGVFLSAKFLSPGGISTGQQLRSEASHLACPAAQALQNYWLSIWSEATASAEAGGDPAALRTKFYMLYYFAFGLSSLAFQASRTLPEAAHCLPADIGFRRLVQRSKQ